MELDRILNNITSNYKQGFELRDKQRDVVMHMLRRDGDLLINLPKDQLAHLKELNISAVRLDIKANVSDATVQQSVDEISTCRYHLDTVVDLKDVIQGQFSLVLCHPEALLNTTSGRILLSSDEMRQNVVAIVVDECHIIEKWGEEFRTPFKKLGDLKVFFPDTPFVALSDTLTIPQKVNIPQILSLKQLTVIESSPNRPNIYLEKRKKESSNDVLSDYESIVHKVCDTLFQEKDRFPVTLLFLPVYYMSECVMYLNSLFGTSTIETCMYSALCSGQDEHVINITIMELKKQNPRIRLVLTTSIAGMGFDPENVTQVIHTCPPRNISQYLQEIGRAGRRGQSAKAILYYGNRHIAKNHLPGINENIINYCRNDDSCLRNVLLSTFGFEKDTSIAGCFCCSICKSTCSCNSCLV